MTAQLSTSDCEYCVDGDGIWIDLPAGTTTESINAGQTLSFKISNSTATPEVGGSDGPESPDGPGGPGVGDEINGANIGTFYITKYCNLLGNAMSMVFGDDAANNTSLLDYDSVFQNLFYGCDTINTVSNNFLPATSLSLYCYANMFQNCTSLTTAPELPATSLSLYCYANMFQNCTSLTIAPELPATTLNVACYDCMFYGCTSLTIAPELPATTLNVACYDYMFYGCTNLSYIKAMFITIPTSNNNYTSTKNWVSNVKSKGTFVKNKNATWNMVGTSAIPSGWTVETV